MNMMVAKLIAIWCAAVISVPRVPMSTATALKSPASAVTITAIGRPSATISFTSPGRGNASRVTSFSGR